MKIYPVLITLGMTLSLGLSTAQAGPNHHRHNHVVVKRAVIVKPTPVRRVVSPRATFRLAILPAGSVPIVYAGDTYYRHGDVYYLGRNGGYIVVNPPAAVRSVRVVRYR